MWWLDPGKEVLNVLFNRILAPYVQNLDLDQVNYGIGQGQLTLRSLRLKKGALDKFRLPVDVLDGHLGKLSLSLHWLNLGNQPAEILVEDVYLLVVPSSQTNHDPEEDEKRAQAAKAERLENAELLHVGGQAESSGNSVQTQGLWESLIAKVINNLQITVKNIHIRYEDTLSVPGHPFAAGVTLAGFTAVSVNEDWEAAFIESTAGAIHKLAKLQSLALYFDTDSPSMAGLPPAESKKKFFDMISHSQQDKRHQFILSPVSGEGRIVVNHRADQRTPRFDVQLIFDEIGVALDDKQYRDIISLLDMYHVYVRQRQYRKYKPQGDSITTAKSRLLFAGMAILEGVRERNRKWTWDYFAERRDDRNKYVDLFEKKALNLLAGAELHDLEALERKLSYEDIRFYRSIARSRLRKDEALRKKLEAERKPDPAKQSWGSWLWGSSSTNASTEDPTFGGPMTAKQRKELYDVLDYDEKEALRESFLTPRDSLKARVAAKLNKGSFALTSDPHGQSKEVISVVFDLFQANFIQRPDNFEVSISLGGFGVFDGTTKDTLFPKIVRVKDLELPDGTSSVPEPHAKGDPFFFLKFEKSPLDERADSALTVRMRHMEIIYHKGYLEAVYKFLKPPASQLESVEALLSVASQTFEGLRKETRAGLEFALTTHKTIDIQVDMNAPIIIIPEDVTTHDCKHLIIDAGHIAIESDLADKDAIRTIHSKRNKKYEDQDYKYLESLMYDKLLLKLDAAQFIVGNNYQSCLDALQPCFSGTLHLLERISIDLQVHNSIVPSALSIARFKISGKLPTLQVNFSDTKYKALMRLIDVCIPKFGDEESRSLPFVPPAKSSGGFQLAAGLFGPAETEYNIDEGSNEDESDNDEDDSREDIFFEADDGTSGIPELRQHVFELNFQVDNLRAAIFKSTPEGVEKSLGDISFNRFLLAFALTEYDMKVDINLRSVSLNLVQPGMSPLRFISSAESGSAFDTHQDLLTVEYTRVQKESPEFTTIYEGIDQTVDIKVSTFIFRAAPEPVVSLYDFIMSTFVPESKPSLVQEVQPGWGASEDQRQSQDLGGGKIRVLVKLASVQVILTHELESLATLSLSTADVMVFLWPTTLRVTGRLGSLALNNDTKAHGIRSEFNQILSIEGQNFAEFRYQTYDPDEESYAGYKSSVYLNAASVKLCFLEQPLRDIYLFLVQLAKLKGLYDAATQVAVQSAPNIDRMQFEVSVKTPILVFPSDPAASRDVLVMELGEITAQNTSDLLVNKISASLTGIQLVSAIYEDDQVATLKIIENIEVTADVVQTSGIDRGVDIHFPDTQVDIKISDVRLHLTEIQYMLLAMLSQSVARTLAGAPEEEASLPVPAISTHPPPYSVSGLQSVVDLEPELRITSSTAGRNWASLDLVVSINAIKLHLYDAGATTEKNLKDHGIARFALNDNTLRFKLLSDGSGEAQVIMRSFTMSNTRPGTSKFREIIPAAQHDRNQFMILYTMAGGSDTSLLVLTIDSPKMIFAVDPMIALLGFFTSAFPSQSPKSYEYIAETEMADSTPKGTLDYRVDLHDLSVSVLENDSDPESQSITLSVNQTLLSQQGIIALSVNRLGMSLMRMGKSSESVRFLDDVDLTLSLDSRSTVSEQLTSMEIAVKPIVFRGSYGDLTMITSIVNKAIALYGTSNAQNTPSDGVLAMTTSRSSEGRSKSSGMRSRHPTIGNAHVLMSKEHLTASFDGFRFVLISDLNEQPMMHLKMKPFIVGAKDWSGELQATTTMAIHITYWNLTNSHWEPLIDPWAFTIAAAKYGPSGGTNVTLSARERLDVNLSTTFAELATTTLNMIGKEGEYALQKPRGIYAPYRIRNRTGSAITVWSDNDNISKAVVDVKILHDQTVDWRFDDWKTMREHVSSSGQHSIGLQFIGKTWDQLRGIHVDREGEFVFSLRPRTKYPSRLLCEVKVVENVKIVTFRSIYKIENQTLYPLELTLVDETGHPAYSMEKIAPGQDYSLPIEAVMQNKIRIQPDQGFGYKWCSAIRFEDLMARKSFTIKCPHTAPSEAAFRFQAWVQTDDYEVFPGKLPKVNLKLRAPLELENLLPYNLEYRIYDKDTDQNWRSYLRKGGIMPVHSVELTHFVLLNVDVQDTVFKPSEFAIINTDGHSDFDIENRITLRDQHNRKLDLRLNYVRYPESGGAFKVQIYSPYIFINKTGLPFSIKSARSTRAGSKDVAGEIQPDVLSRPFPFLLSHPHENGHEFILKVGDSVWSKIISVEAPAAESALVVESQKRRSDEIHVGVTWSEGLGKYKLTKVITLTPRFLIKNNLKEAISFREHGAPPRDRSVINPGERQWIQVIRAGARKLLTIAYPGLNALWSSPINIEDIGTVYFRLRAPSDDDAQVRLIRADLQVDGSTIFISFSSTQEWPFAVENDSDHVIKLSQQDVDREDEGRSTKVYPSYTINPHTSASYAWDFPAARDKKLVLMISNAWRVIDIMEIGNLIPFKFNDNQRTRTVSLDVRADGHQQILRITSYNPEQSMYKPRERSNSGSIVRQDTISSTADAFEAVTENVTPTLIFAVEFAGIGISLVNKRLIEVVYVSLDTLKLEYTDSTAAQAFNLSCGVLQVDNQLHDALYPVVIQPTPIAKEANGVAALPTVQASILWLKDQEHGVLFVKYCSILLQALTIEADEDLLFAFYDLTQIKGSSWEAGTEDVLLQNIETIPEPVDNAVGQELYFEILELQPIKLSLSFMRTERVSSEEKLSIRNPLAVVVNALTMTVGNINDAPLELNALGIKDMRLTMPELQTRIAYHYRQDVLRQLYRILGSADFIGNPVGLFTNVSSGVADIFYEPFHGVVMHGNKELGIGIAKGAASFLKKTVFGLSDSMTKFTSSVGKGLSAATFDSEYQARRRMAQRRNKPRHAIYGVAAGGEAFASSITSAMEGVLMKPIEGAESEGAFGFFKGVGKGLVGVVTKPVIGVFDLAANVSEGIRNTTTVFDNPDRERTRLPRHVPADGVLRPYSPREALGQYWMKDLNNGAYRKEAYVAHIYSTGDDNVVLLTASRLLSFQSKHLRLDWELPFTDVQGVTVEDTGIRFAHKAGKENDKFAFIPDKGTQSWFFGYVASVVKAFNTKKRMDG